MRPALKGRLVISNRRFVPFVAYNSLARVKSTVKCGNFSSHLRLMWWSVYCCYYFFVYRVVRCTWFSWTTVRCI